MRLRWLAPTNPSVGRGSVVPPDGKLSNALKYLLQAPSDRLATGNVWGEVDGENSALLGL